jgi:class 3 adenylate cyclase
MDRHYSQEITETTIAIAHQRDLAVQEKHGLKFLTYWFDEARCTAFCLIDAPNKEAIQAAHDEAHGMVPHEIIDVDESVVSAFLGRLSDPVQAKTNDTPPIIGTAFRVIMFTDLLDSTKMNADHGDSIALHLLHINNALTRNSLRSHCGSEVKHTGDGIMASFTSVGNAIECAIDIQESFSKHNLNNPNEALYLRIGLSAGEPIEEAGDLFGTAVQQAARLCNHAEPETILVTQVVRDLYKDKPLSFSDLGDISFKGFDEKTRVFQIDS